MSGHLVAEREVEPRTAPGDTASERLTIDASSGCPVLEQRVIRFAPGRSGERVLAGRQDVLYVAEGRGTVVVDGKPYEVEPDTGLYVGPGLRWEVDNPGPDELVVVAVSAPGGSTDAGGPVAVRYAERQRYTAGGDREFRYLVDADSGSADVTQFVGVIPPGRAPDHSHTYDEVIYVVEGEGVLHVGDRHEPITVGSCIHLPPLVTHCLENTGTRPMRVLGVFHPAGDPASRAFEGE